jgi:hypothetical protein
MELLDRYLQAVKKHLPWQRQDDIIAELRANLEAQLEDKVAALGRPLTMGEAEDWLRQIGPPIQVAARYQPQQYLIGPAVFPTYCLVLRLACFWATIAYLIGSAAQIATQTPSWVAVSEAVLRVPGVLMTAAAWVTLIFAAIEFTAAHYPAKSPAVTSAIADWKPSTLPPLEKEAGAGVKPRNYAHAVAEVVFGFLFLLWLLLVRQHPYLLIGPGAAYLPGPGSYESPFQFAPVCLVFYWWVIALSALQLVWRCVDLIRGAWRQSRRAPRFAMGALGLIPLALLLSVRDHAWVTLRHPALDQARYGAAVDSINKTIYLGVLFFGAITVLELIWAAGRMSLDSYRKRAAAMR